MPEESRRRILLACEALSLVLAIAFVAVRPLISAEPFGPAHNLALSCAPLVAWLAAVLARAALEPDLPVPRPSVSLPLAAFLVLVIASPLVASSTWPAAMLAAVWVAHLCLLQHVGLFDRGGNLLRATLAALLAAGAVIVLFSFTQWAVLIPETRQRIVENPELMHAIPAAQREEFLTRLWVDEPYGTFVTQNTLAGFLALLFPLFLLLGSWALRGEAPPRRPRALILLGVAVLSIMLLTLTASKGGAGALAVTLAAWGLLEKRAFLRRHARGAAVAAVLLGALGAWAAFGWSRDPLGIHDPLSSLSFRFGYWSGAWRLAQAHPLAGVGLDNFADHYLSVKDDFAHEVQRVHNDWLQLAAELGFPGLLAFAALWAAVLWPVVRGRPEEAGSPPPVPPGSAGTATDHAGATHAANATRAEAALSPRTVTILAGATGALAIAVTEVAAALPLVAIGVWIAVYACAAGSLDTLRTDAARRAELARALAAGIAGSLAHGVVDMNLYVHNYSAALFLLGGALLALGAPGESVPITPRARRSALLACGLLAFGLVAGWFVIFARLIPAERARDDARYGTGGRPPTRDEQRRDLLQSVTLNPWDPAALATYAAHLHDDCRRLGSVRGSHPELVQHLLEPCEAAAIRAAAAAPLNPSLAAGLAGVYWDHAHILERHAREVSGDAEADRRRARECIERAHETARHAVARYPSNPHHRLLLARVLDALDRRAEAEEHYRAALALSRRQVLERLRIPAETVVDVRKRLGE